MRRTLTLILGVALFGILAAVVVASQGADDPVSTTDTVTDTVERTTTVEDNPKRERADDDAQNGVDISGPCDEAEHANDPRCAGQAPTTRRPQGDEDNSGPCDEAEHAQRPRSPARRAVAWTTRAPAASTPAATTTPTTTTTARSAAVTAVATTTAVTTTTAATAAVATTTDEPGAPARLPFTPWRAGAPS